MNWRILITSILLATIQIHGEANSKHSAIDTIFTLIYNQQYEKADSLLIVSNDQFDAFYSDILKMDLYWWKYVTISSNNELHQLNQLLKDFNLSGRNKLDFKLKELITLSYQLRLKLMRFNVPAALILRSRIKQLLLEINRKELSFSENKLKLFDLYNILFLYFDNIFNPFFLESKRTERTNALSQIEHYTHENDLIVETLAHYFLGKIYINIENNPRKGKIHFEILSKKYPRNLLFSELAANC